MNRKVIVLLLIPVLITTGVIIYFKLNDEPQYSLTEPFEIDSDIELESIAKERQWEGQGTQDDPIVISSLYVNATVDNSITIKNTRYHLIIKDNAILNSKREGIYLHNVENVVISDNILANIFGDAIYINSSRNVEVKNNDISNIKSLPNGRTAKNYLNFAVSIDIQFSSHINVNNNNITNSFDGIWAL